MQRKKGGNFAQLLYAVSLFLVFSVCSMFLVTIGANNYKGFLGETDKYFNTNASLHYVTNKLHAYDKAGGISFGDENGIKIIILNEDSSSSGNQTLIYYSGGYLCEQTKQKLDRFSPESGVKILPVNNFSFELLSNNCVKLSAEESGSDAVFTVVSLKCSDVGVSDNAAA